MTFGRWYADAASSTLSSAVVFGVSCYDLNSHKYYTVPGYIKRLRKNVWLMLEWLTTRKHRGRLPNERRLEPPIWKYHRFPMVWFFLTKREQRRPSQRKQEADFWFVGQYSRFTVSHEDDGLQGKNCGDLCRDSPDSWPLIYIRRQTSKRESERQALCALLMVLFVGAI